VQTFLPYPDFARTAAVLDDRRLGKQRVEVLQILNAMHRTNGG
jgi:Pyrimidine dimer DNA glycosylase